MLEKVNEFLSITEIPANNSVMIFFKTDDEDRKLFDMFLLERTNRIKRNVRKCGSLETLLTYNGAGNYLAQTRNYIRYWLIAFAAAEELITVEKLKKIGEIVNKLSKETINTALLKNEQNNMQELVEMAKTIRKEIIQ